MFAYDQLSRVAVATVGALVLSTLSVAAAVAPAQSGEPARTVIASAPHGTQANG